MISIYKVNETPESIERPLGKQEDLPERYIDDDTYAGEISIREIEELRKDYLGRYSNQRFKEYFKCQKLKFQILKSYNSDF